jgi:SAM-dependent methyltransferase
MSEFDTAYYEQDSLWSHHAADGDSAVMFAAITALLPDGITTVLDVGCGNGVISDRLAERFEVIGGDRSMAALRYVRSMAVQLSGDRLPFPDGSFDLVLCTDVIEHLDDALERAVLAELCRVSRRFVLVCVPHAEPLGHFQITCTGCGNDFHAHHHQRSYRADRFGQLDGMVPRAAAEFGSRWPCADESVSQFVHRATGAGYRFPHPVCPFCGAQPVPAEESPEEATMRRRFESLQYLLAESGQRPWPVRSEIAVLLEKAVASDGEAVTPERISTPTVHLPARVRVVADRCGDALLTFPDDWYWIAEPNRAVVMLPRLPLVVRVVSGAVRAVWVFDHVSGSFLPAATGSSDSQTFGLPLVAPDLYGYRVAFDCDDPEELDIELDARPPLTPTEAAAVAFGADSSRHQAAELSRRLESAGQDYSNLLYLYDETYARLQQSAAALADVNDLANSIEAARSSLELRLASAVGATRGERIAESRCREAYEHIAHLNKVLVSVNESLQSAQSELERLRQMEMIGSTESSSSSRRRLRWRRRG